MDASRVAAAVARYGIPETEAVKHQIAGFTRQGATTIYQGHMRQELARLGYADRRVVLRDHAARATIDQYARDAADGIPTAYNSRLAAHLGTLPDGASDDDLQSAAAGFRDRAQQYNKDTLIPNQASWARHQAVSHFYERNTSPRTGRSLAESVQWDWERGSGSSEPDSCQRAADSSPAPRSSLIDAGGAAPPVHRNCACSLTPQPPDPADLPPDDALWLG